jgi:putative protease
MGVKKQQILLDHSLYIFSKEAKGFFQNQGFGMLTLPLELSGGELAALSGSGCMLCIYGHAPFMVSSQCVNRTMYGCDRTPKRLSLRDRYGKELPVKNYCSVCCNLIYNAVPTVLFDGKLKKELWRIRPQALRMDFTVEDASETARVLAAYEYQMLGRGGEAVELAFTRGHFKHGVE